MNRLLSFVYVALVTLLPAAPVVAASTHNSFAGFRGKIVTVTEIGSFTPAQLRAEQRKLSLSDAALGPCGTKLYKIQYLTPNLNGEPTTVSGLVILPTGVKRAPLASYQHGTATNKEDTPSNFTRKESKILALEFGSACYVVIAADYLGLGVDPGPHPYLHADTEASAAVDMILASLQFLSKMNIDWNRQLFLLGYSQGGHATMALHRSLQWSPLPQIQVTASAPMAGPYDLSGVSLRVALAEPSPNTSTFASYLMLSMNRVYHLYSNLAELIRAPFVEILSSLFDGSYKTAQIAARLPPNPKELFQPNFLKEVASLQMNPIRAALKKNDVYEWVPAVPMRLYHSHGDKDVSFQNSLIAAEFMKSRGADVQVVDVGNLSHVGGYLPSMTRALMWFNSLVR